MCRSHNLNFYSVLGICTDATPAVVRAAYHHAALRTHPDKGGSSEEFRLASRAFQVLSCPASRRGYDSSRLPLSRQRPGPGGSAATRFVATNTTAATSPGPKRKRMSLFPKRRAKVKKNKPLRTTLTALHRLREVLQAMTVKSRREVFTGMTQAMRKTLAQFMERVSCEISPQVRGTHALGARQARHSAQSTATGIRICNRARQTMYQAQMHVKALRLYACPQNCLNSAIEHQIQLSRLRYVITAEEKADPGIWCDANKVYHVCQIAFKEMGTSEHDLGLRAFVHIRAQSWLGQGVQVTSSSTTLSTALDAHTRLLSARATSWEVFRAEWIQLMLGKGRLTLTESEAVADKARQAALQHQVVKALRGAEQALDREQRRARKRAPACARTHGLDATEFVDAKLRPKRTRMSNVAFLGG